MRVAEISFLGRTIDGLGATDIAIWSGTSDEGRN